MKNKAIFSVIFNSCILFTLFSILINSFFAVLYIGDDGTNLPKIAINYLTLVISIIISLLILLLTVKLKKELIFKKINVIYFISCLYTSIFLVLNISTVILKNVWNIYTILMILAVSILTGIFKFFVHINKILKAIIYFCIYAVPYFIISISFAGFGKGNMLIVVITVYLLAFALIYIASHLVDSILKRKNNNNQKYEKLFK